MKKTFVNPLAAATDGIYGQAQENGLVRLEHATLTPTGIQIWNGLDEPEWERLGKAIQGMQTALQWYLGDWMAHGYRTWKMTYEDTAAKFGYKTKTLYEYAHVSLNVPFSIRNGKVSFAHHQLVTNLAPDLQRHWLAEAVEHQWTVRQMRAAMEGTTALLDDPHQRRIEKTFIALGRLHPSRIEHLNIQRAQEHLGNIEAARQRLDELERELLKRLD